tara:strand:+ start:1333 stop:1902 length:570 start_codon:yes stop_codon:yes gene_type:complete
MKKIILIDNYDSFTFNLYHYLSSFKINVDVIRNDQITSNEILKKKYNKIVISPGPGNPNQSGNCLKIVKSLYKKIPILGVCLGHQIIGQVFGSKIIQARKLVHGKTSKILSKKIGILKNLPKSFEATRYHSLIIEKKSLSKNLEITAESKDGLIMGVQHKEYDVHGVQFHPESIKTKLGIKILKNFIRI